MIVMSTDEIVLSVAVPVFNERESLPELHRRVAEVMSSQSDPWELILFGHQIAVTAGLDACRGQAIVIMDADLQDPPEVIPELVDKWREGYEVVYAVRAEREGETWFKKMTAALFYRMINRITDVDIPLDTGDFRLMDRQVIDVLTSMREKHRFPRAMVAWVGFRQTGVEYERAARFAGETKYPFSKMLRLAINAITGFSYFPLQIATYLGFASAGLSILAIPLVILLRLIGNEAFFGQASTLIAVLFLGGVQLISLGILGEYIGRLYDEAKGRPLYITRKDTEKSKTGMKERSS
jgi:dolichol-phosphate mannosyltransferase